MTLPEAVSVWRKHTRYGAPDDWPFASPAAVNDRIGVNPVRKLIRPAAISLGITEHVVWHTCRHTYPSMLRATSADNKIYAGVASTRVKPGHISYAYASGCITKTRSAE